MLTLDQKKMIINNNRAALINYLRNEDEAIQVIVESRLDQYVQDDIDQMVDLARKLRVMVKTSDAESSARRTCEVIGSVVLSVIVGIILAAALTYVYQMIR